MRHFTCLHVFTARYRVLDDTSIQASGDGGATWSPTSCSLSRILDWVKCGELQEIFINPTPLLPSEPIFWRYANTSTYYKLENGTMYRSTSMNKRSWTPHSKVQSTLDNNPMCSRVPDPDLSPLADSGPSIVAGPRPSPFPVPVRKESCPMVIYVYQLGTRNPTTNVVTPLGSPVMLSSTKTAAQVRDEVLQKGLTDDQRKIDNLTCTVSALPNVISL